MSEPAAASSQSPDTGSSGRRALLVTGMHRSGTSALTRTLSLVGGTLASRLAGGVTGDNDLGFWEPVEVVALHDRALASAGSAWDDVSRFPEAWFASDVGRACGDELLVLLQREFADTPLFAIKDPRLCRLVPLWLAVLPRLGVRGQFVLPLRSPVEVAASLKARNDFPLAKSYLVWLRNVLDAERATRGQDRVFVTYEALLQDWRGVVRCIGESLGIQWPRLSRSAEAEIEDFLSPELRRQRADWAQVRQQGEVPLWVVRTYDALLRLSEGDPAAQAELDAVRGELDLADDTYGRALAGMGFRVDAAEAGLRTAEQSLAEASAARDAYSREAERLRGVITSEAERYKGMIERQEAATAGVQETLGKARVEIQGLWETIDGLNTEISRLNALAAEQQRVYEERIAEQQQAYEARIAEIFASASWRITAPVRGAVERLRKLRDSAGA